METRESTEYNAGNNNNNTNITSNTNNNTNTTTTTTTTNTATTNNNAPLLSMAALPAGWLNDDDDEEWEPSDDERRDEPEAAPEDDYLGIAQRTRARHSLNDVALQQLEDALVPHESTEYDWEELIPEPDEPINRTTDSSEHVADDEYSKFLQQLRGQAELEDNDHADEEYNFEEDLKRHPINERYDLAVPHATIIPQREIHDLIHPADDAMQYRKRQKERVFAAAAVRLKPILPLNDQGVRFMNQSRLSSPFLFSAAQLQQLKAQIVEHHQLLIQVFLLTKRLIGHEHVTSTAWDLLQEMHQYRTVMMSYWSLRDKTVTQPPHPTLAPVTPVTPVTGSSVFEVGIPLSEIITALQAVVSLPRKLTAEEFEQFVVLLRPYFNPHLKIELDQTANTTSRLKFTPAEDRLLLIGLERFGTRDWDSIHKYILPTKDVKQLVNRFKNKTAKSAKDNAIKQFYTAQLTPLTEQERALLEQGVMLHGLDFETISRLMLPHRHSHILHKLWKRLHKHKSDTSHAHKHKRPRLNENFLTAEVLDEPEARDYVTITVHGVHTPINRTTVKLAHLEQVLEEHEHRTENTLIGRKRPRSPSQEVSYEAQGNEFEVEELLSDDEEHFEVEELEDSDEEVHEQLADNMTVVDGQTIVWTKDEDRLLLSAARDSGPKLETWNTLAQSNMTHRSSKQIAERYAQLVELLRQRIGSQIAK